MGCATSIAILASFRWLGCFFDKRKRLPGLLRRQCTLLFDQPVRHGGRVPPRTKRVLAQPVQHSDGVPIEQPRCRRAWSGGFGEATRHQYRSKRGPTYSNATLITREADSHVSSHALTRHIITVQAGSGVASSNIAVVGSSSSSRPPILSSPCQQVRNPVCGAAATGGPCNVASQQCCAQRTQRVCRQVPVRTIRKIKQLIPGRQTWKRECRTVPFNRTVVSYKTEYQTVEEFREYAINYPKNIRVITDSTIPMAML